MCGCGKCGRKLYPFSFGLALGIVSGLATLIWVIWSNYYGPSAMMVTYHIPVPTFSEGSMHALLALVKGFVFGFFLALFYNLIAWCCRKCCGRKGECACGTPESKPESKPEAGK